MRSFTCTSGLLLNFLKSPTGLQWFNYDPAKYNAGLSGAATIFEREADHRGPVL
jgi:hypothetical protein